MEDKIPGPNGSIPKQEYSTAQIESLLRRLTFIREEPQNYPNRTQLETEIFSLLQQLIDSIKNDYITRKEFVQHFKMLFGEKKSNALVDWIVAQRGSGYGSMS